MKTAHIITSLNQGGAEEMLYKLLKQSISSGKDQKSFIVFCLTSKGLYSSKLCNLGIKVIHLNLKSKKNILLSFYYYIQEVRKFKPDIIHAWMYHANIVASITKIFYRKTKVIWGVRCCVINQEKYINKFVFKLGAILSKFPESITYNSYSASYAHKEHGYCAKNSTIISNGFCPNLLKKSHKIYHHVRSTFGFYQETKIIGIFARYHPVKDYDGFLKVAAIVKRKYSGNLIFLMAGTGVTKENIKLIDLVNKYSLEKSTLFLGCVNSSEYMPALDLSLSTSIYESFSNSIGESLLCGVPCVATDVGDSKKIIDKYGAVTKPRDYLKMADEVLKIINMSDSEYNAVSLSARTYMIENYSIESCMKNYSNLYKKIT